MPNYSDKKIKEFVEEIKETTNLSEEQIRQLPDERLAHYAALCENEDVSGVAMLALSGGGLGALAIHHASSGNFVLATLFGAAAAGAAYLSLTDLSDDGEKIRDDMLQEIENMPAQVVVTEQAPVPAPSSGL